MLKDNFILLAECEVRTASYGPSFFPFFYGPSAKKTALLASSPGILYPAAPCPGYSAFLFQDGGRQSLLVVCQNKGNRVADCDDQTSLKLDWGLPLYASPLARYRYSGGVGAVVKISAFQSLGPQFDYRPGRGLNICVTFFPAKVHPAFHPSGVDKMSTNIHGPI